MVGTPSYVYILIIVIVVRSHVMHTDRFYCRIGSIRYHEADFGTVLMDAEGV